MFRLNTEDERKGGRMVELLQEALVDGSEPW